LSVTYYGKGKHPSGFVGFRVVRSWNDGADYRQCYFPTSSAQSQSNEDVYFRYQKLRADYQDVCWEVESLEYQYRRFVTMTNARTKPERGLGVHGITAMFARWHGGMWEPCFSVSRPSKPQKRFFFRHHPFTQAWALAVDHWALANGILEVDRERVLNTPPDPSQFKRLRRHMNDVEGFDIPVEALGPVFQEQRERITEKHSAEKIRSLKLSETSSDHSSQLSTEREILAWFKLEREKVG